jgi:hypothetical protein
MYKIKSILTSFVLVSFGVILSENAVNASVNGNVKFVIDGKSRTVSISLTDRSPNKICADRTVSGEVRFTYVATAQSLTLSKIEIYNASSKHEVALDVILRVNKNQVLEGSTLMSPSGSTNNSIRARTWSTLYDYYSIKTFKSKPMPWTARPQMAIKLEKSDSKGGTLLCNGEWLIGFIKGSTR